MWWMADTASSELWRVQLRLGRSLALPSLPLGVAEAAEASDVVDGRHGFI